MSLDTIFFDVGNTLVFPNPQETLAPLLTLGIVPTVQQFDRAERAAKRSLDEFYSRPRQADTDYNYWDAYYVHLLAELKVSNDELKRDLMARARTSANWDSVRPNTADVLRELRRKYRLAVISNADGRIVQLLERLGLAEFFETITDSGSVGYEKPDPRIFRTAISSSDAEPSRSMHVGDIYSVDYLGAVNVGMRALLLDRAGVYESDGYPRVDALEKIPGLLLWQDQPL
ncbi:MAG TPA: HAD family hydrolase [Terriglobales bacterium]|nr:HAD family hydrolase [Terriglobales bacterium]